jgi:hypothetical protein
VFSKLCMPAGIGDLRRQIESASFRRCRRGSVGRRGRARVRRTLVFERTRGVPGQGRTNSELSSSGVGLVISAGS